MKRNLHFLVILFCVACFAGCESKIKQLNSQKLSSEQRLAAVEAEISALQNQSNKLTADLKANHNQTVKLIRENPGTASCIAAGEVALSEGNTFSKDIKDLGAWYGIGCLVFYIGSEDFQKSADAFVEQLEAASDRDKSLQAQINSLKPQIQTRTRDWREEKTVLEQISKQISALQTR